MPDLNLFGDPARCMPELPEVETVRRGLQAGIKGACIERVELRRTTLRTPLPANLNTLLQGRKINEISRRGKYLLFHLQGGVALIAHLGMSGRFRLLNSPPHTYEKHDHVIFFLQTGGVLVFNDARRFGLMALVNEAELPTHPLLAALGPEPLSEDFNAAYLAHALARRKGPIKPALMDASLVVGVGNIYASEALFAARIHPQAVSRHLVARSQELVQSIRSVLNAAIASGGSSLRDFVHASGNKGYFQHEFQVYGRSGAPCFHCRAPIHVLFQAGRSSFFCQACQNTI